jgi:hypothetical protein
LFLFLFPIPVLPCSSLFLFGYWLRDHALSDVQNLARDRIRKESRRQLQYDNYDDGAVVFPHESH